jgi:hypothetical protein
VPSKFLTPESYLAHWIESNEAFFPSKGGRVTVWCHDLDLVNDIEQLHYLVRTLADQTDIVDEVDAWVDKGRML